MKNLILIFAGIPMLLVSFQAAADKLYRWEDDSGRVIYQDVPPSGGVEFEEQEYEIDPPKPSVEVNIAREAEKSPVAIYVVSDCGSCDLVRLYLEQRKIPFEEKNVQEDILLQEELMEKTGRLEVPVLTVGDQLVEGYSRSAIGDLLREAGFPVNEIEQELEEVQSAKDKAAGVKE